MATIYDYLLRPEDADRRQSEWRSVVPPDVDLAERAQIRSGLGRDIIGWQFELGWFVVGREGDRIRVVWSEIPRDLDGIFTGTETSHGFTCSSCRREQHRFFYEPPGYAPLCIICRHLSDNERVDVREAFFAQDVAHRLNRFVNDTGPGELVIVLRRMPPDMARMRCVAIVNELRNGQRGGVIGAINDGIEDGRG